MKMKRFASLLIALTLLCGLFAITANAADLADLKFKQDGTFKIIQVADLQEFALSSKITRDFLYALAERERPDLFILTGDNIHCNPADYFPGFLGRALIKSGIDGYMNVFDKIYKDFGARVTMVYGNHDNEAMQTITKPEEFAMYAAHKSFAGYYIPEADEGTQDEQGQHYGTHHLIIKNSEATPVFGLWMFDSGSYDPRGGYSCVQKPQIDWFKAANEASGKLPSLVFQHIAVPEVYDYLTPAQAGDPNTLTRNFIDADGNPFKKIVSMDLPAGAGGELNESAGCGIYNQGQYDALNEAGNVLAMFWGHDHNNTYQLKRPGSPDLVSSPSTGFGSYGDTRMRGAQVITLHESDLTTYDTYVIFYQDFCSDNALQQSRLEMFNTMHTWANIFDVMLFRPLLWLLGLLG